MTPDDKFQQSGMIRRDLAPLDTVTSSKAGLSTAGTRITRVSSRQTAMSSQSLHGPAGDVPVTTPGRSRNARRQTDPLGPDTDLDGLQAVSPGLQLLRMHGAYKRTSGGPFFILLLIREETGCTFQMKSPS